MNWLALLMKSLSLIAPVVMAVQVIAGDNATGASKQKMAEDALSHAAEIAGTILSDSDRKKSDAITALVAAAIPIVVGHLKATGAMASTVHSPVVTS